MAVCDADDRVKPYDDKETREHGPLALCVRHEGARLAFKMECCGASKDAHEQRYDSAAFQPHHGHAITLGADAIVTPCPLCQMNLDLLPALGRSAEVAAGALSRRSLSSPLYGNMLGAASPHDTGESSAAPGEGGVTMQLE